MSQLFEKSLRTLELHKVLELLAQQAYTPEGKERCMSLRPFTDPAEVSRRLGETSDALSMLVLHGTPGLSGVCNVGAPLQRAEMGGSMTAKELLDVAGLLRCARTAKEYTDGEGREKTRIDHLFASLSVDRGLEEQIFGSIISPQEISDSASAELADIRRHIRAASGKVRELLQKLISSPQSKYLQEQIITMRSGRFVVPVKSEYKNEIPGLVHDLSGTGSTFFIEPMAVVKTNNELKELTLREEREIARILLELSLQCAKQSVDINENYNLLVMIDCIFARASLSAKMKACEPKISADVLELNRARHPLLDVETAVCNDLKLGDEFDTLVVTGPNTGGKTVTLKTLGLLSLMAQCGLHIPVRDDSTIRVFKNVFADIGDEQSIAQSLSTFSSHMKNIVGILEESGVGSLVLFDELGAGTDPIEGAALAAAIIETTRTRGALVAATTHYAELKVYAMTTPGVENASCEFDVETLAPTYRVLIGIPGKSNAFAISERLGLPSTVIERAKSRIDSESIRFEDVLTQLDEQRQAMEKEKDVARRLRYEIEQTSKETQSYKEKIDAERKKAVEKAEAEARKIIEEARNTADEVFNELKIMRKKQAKEANWQKQNDARAGLLNKLNRADDRLGQKEAEAVPPMVRPAVSGDRVRHLKMGVEAEVVNVKKDGGLELQAGILKLTAKQEEVRVVEGGTKKKEKQVAARATHKLRSLGASQEVDLRGMMTDEAVMVMERFLDSAIMGRLSKVTIIHGVGTGAVRNAVRSQLKRTKHVKSFRPGMYGEGEDGVTIVEL